MTQYQRILVPIELNEKSDALLVNKAREIKQQSNVDLILLHVIENMVNYGAAYGIVVGVDIEQALQEEARKSMAELAALLNVPVNKQILRMGSPAHIILEEAKEKHVDLILLGSHGRHGVRLLLGSTANSVLHGAQCDVLAVRLQD